MDSDRFKDEFFLALVLGILGFHVRRLPAAVFRISLPDGETTPHVALRPIDERQWWHFVEIEAGSEAVHVLDPICPGNHLDQAVQIIRSAVLSRPHDDAPCPGIASTASTPATGRQ